MPIATPLDGVDPAKLKALSLRGFCDQYARARACVSWGVTPDEANIWRLSKSITVRYGYLLHGISHRSAGMGRNWLIVLFMFVGPAWADQLPDWPRPPTESDCRAFQSAINEYFRQADQEYRACAQNSHRSCGDAPARRGAASVRRASIAACFMQAQQQSSRDAIITFLEGDRKDDGVAAVGSVARRIDLTLAELEDLRGLRANASDYAHLSATEKLRLHRDLALRLNGYSERLGLSKDLTADSISHITEIHADALAQLDSKLRELTQQHLRLVQRRELIADLKRRLEAQELRSADADVFNRKQLEALRRERRERDAENAAIEEEEARERVRWAAARAQALLRRQQIEAEMQAAEVAAVFGAFVGAFSANYNTRSPSYRPVPLYRGGATGGGTPTGMRRDGTVVPCAPGPGSCAFR